MTTSIFFGNPIFDGNQVIYVTPSLGGDYYIGSVAEGSSNIGSAYAFSYDTSILSKELSIQIKIAGLFDTYGKFSYLFSEDAGSSYIGCSEASSPVAITAPFVGELGVTTYDHPFVCSSRYGDCVAFAQKWTTAAGKQIVSRQFDYSEWSWGTETVVFSSTAVQDYPSAYMLDGKHIVCGFIDDSDAADRKVKLCMSQDLLGLTWDQLSEFTTASQLYNLSLCKIGDTVVAAYDDGTDTSCRISFNNGYYFIKEANEVTIKAGATEPYVINNGNNMFMCFVLDGDTPSVYARISQFGQTWGDADSADPLVAGDGVTDTMSRPAAFLDSDASIVCISRSDQQKTYMTKTENLGETWSDYSSLNDDILPDNNAVAACDTGGLTMFLLKGLGSAKSIGALVGRIWTKVGYFTYPLDHDYFAINGKPDSVGWTLTGNDNTDITDDECVIDTVTPGATEQTYYTLAWSPTITDGFVDVFRMKCASGGGNDQSCIRRYDINGGLSFCLAFSTVDVTLKDLQATSDLGTDTHDYTGFHDFVVAVKKVGSDVTYNIWRKEATDNWQNCTKIFNGPDDGYFGEGGARTSQTGFGDNSTTNNENSTGHWNAVLYQDQSDDGLSAASLTENPRFKGGRKSMHWLNSDLGLNIMGAGGGLNNTYTCHFSSNVSHSNLFSTVIDAPLITNTDDVLMEIWIDARKYAANSKYHLDILGFKGANIRKINVHGTSTAGAAWTDPRTGINYTSPPDTGTWTSIATLDSYIGETGAITDIGETWVTISGKTWIRDQYKDYLCELDDGGGTVKIYKIFENTADTLIFYGTEIVTDTFANGDTVRICSGMAAQEVSLASYTFLRIQIEAVQTRDGYYKLPFFSAARKFAPNAVFYNPQVDDKHAETWKPNVDLYQGRTGLRRAHKLGDVRKERTLIFLTSDTDLDENLEEFKKWIEYIDFEKTPVVYIPDTSVKQGSNYYDFLLGRILGGMTLGHDIENKFTVEALTFSEEV